MAGFDRSRNSKGALAEINVTPFVDVMLVLLVIFMITAPMMKMGAEIELPEATLDPLSAPGADEEFVIRITADQRILLGKQPYTREELEQKIGPIVKSLKPGIPVYIEADKKTPYGFVMQTLETLKKGGLDKFGLITIPPEEEAR